MARVISSEFSEKVNTKGVDYILVSKSRYLIIFVKNDGTHDYFSSPTGDCLSNVEFAFIGELTAGINTQAKYNFLCAKIKPNCSYEDFELPVEEILGGYDGNLSSLKRQFNPQHRYDIHGLKFLSECWHWQNYDVSKDDYQDNLSKESQHYQFAIVFVNL